MQPKICLRDMYRWRRPWSECKDQGLAVRFLDRWIYGLNMVFHALTFARSCGRCWKPRPKAGVFNTSQGTWRMLMHWKAMFDRYYCIKTENICYISHYFLHYFVLLMSRERNFHYARSRARHYTSRDGSNSVAPVRVNWKLRSHALTARELPC